MNFNSSLLEKAYQITKKRSMRGAGVKMSQRRRNAINKAYELLLRNPFIHYENGKLLLLSESKTEDGSAKFYETSAKECRLIEPGNFLCHAFWEGFPCWHRAAFEIVENYFEIAGEPNGDENARTVHVVNN
jgi:hypothetical protein